MKRCLAALAVTALIVTAFAFSAQAYCRGCAVPQQTTGNQGAAPTPRQNMRNMIRDQAAAAIAEEALADHARNKNPDADYTPPSYGAGGGENASAACHSARKNDGGNRRWSSADACD